jgi:hypothetical protein
MPVAGEKMRDVTKNQWTCFEFMRAHFLEINKPISYSIVKTFKKSKHAKTRGRLRGNLHKVKRK